MHNKSVLKYPYVPRKNDKMLKIGVTLIYIWIPKIQLKMIFCTFVLILRFDSLKLTIFKGIYALFILKQNIGYKLMLFKKGNL